MASEVVLRWAVVNMGLGLENVKCAGFACQSPRAEVIVGVFLIVAVAVTATSVKHSPVGTLARFVAMLVASASIALIPFYVSFVVFDVSDPSLPAMLWVGLYVGSVTTMFVVLYADRPAVVWARGDDRIVPFRVPSMKLAKVSVAVAEWVFRPGDDKTAITETIEEGPPDDWH